MKKQQWALKDLKHRDVLDQSSKSMIEFEWFPLLAGFLNLYFSTIFIQTRSSFTKKKFLTKSRPHWLLKTTNYD